MFSVFTSSARRGLAMVVTCCSPLRLLPGGYGLGMQSIIVGPKGPPLIQGIRSQW